MTPPTTLQRLFAPVAAGDGEVTEVLARGEGVRVERIVSTGQASPAGFWYEQDEDEWVAVLSGRAGLEVEGEGVVEMGPGDAVVLGAGKRHRVAWTAAGEATVWLAVFYRPARPQG